MNSVSPSIRPSRITCQPGMVTFPSCATGWAALYQILSAGDGTRRPQDHASGRRKLGAMQTLALTLTHFRLCPFSRSIRLALGELGLEATLVDERPWEWPARLVALNPAGEVPVLTIEGRAVLSGAYAIAEYLADETARDAGDGRAVPLFPGTNTERAEVRRLVDWFHRKYEREVTREVLAEKVYPRLSGPAAHAPDAHIMRAVRINLRHHMSYVSFLSDHRRWLAGEEISFADLAAAAHLSTLDYLNEVPWHDYPVAKAWYARLKSRPSFRALLADRVPRVPPPPPHYANLDF